MKSEALGINDERFLVNRLIQQAPTSTLVREFFKNAEENAALAKPGNRLVRIYPTEVNGVKKLTFWNTGIGMNASELRSMTDLSSSINKSMALDGNYGIGAKVSGLSLCKEGIRYRSCKNGRVHEVTIGYDEDIDTYARLAVQMSDGTSETVYDVTASVIKEGISTDFDWTEAVLYGESEDHDTVAEPMGKGKSVDRSHVTSTIFRRFAKLADGLEVKIDVAMTKGGGKDQTGRTRRLKTLDDVIAEINLKDEIVKDANSGIAVHYVHDPKHEGSSHSSSSRANPATASTTFCAIVHKNERYDLKTKKAWSSVAPNFGIPFGSRVLTVEIIVPDQMALPNQYRDALTRPDDRSPLLIEDFSSYVRELMPEWVKDVIRSESPQANDNIDDLQSDLQKLLDEFRVPTVTQTYSKKLEAERSKEADEGENLTEKIIIDAEELSEELYSELKILPDTPENKRANKKKIRQAPEGAQASLQSKALERVPDIKILIEPDEILEKSMKGRAGRYYRDAQIIFVNGLYPVIDRMAAELERELAGDDDPEKVREVAVRASRRFVALRVGKAVCYAISKKLATDDWTMDDLDKATLPESLSMAADDYKQHLGIAKKWAKEQFKLGLVSEAA